MTRKEAEKRVIRQMIGIFCRHREGNRELCSDCRELLEYAEERIDRCPLGEKKTTCRLCTIHCYHPDMKEKVRHVMRYSGPRMLIYSPFEALKHIWREFRAKASS